MFDIVEWEMINTTGTADIQFTSAANNISSSILLLNPSDDYTSIWRCTNSYSRYLYTDTSITTGMQFKLFIVVSSQHAFVYIF